MNPNTMTIDDIRDELARREGWTRYSTGGWHNVDGRFSFDPIPATLDYFASQMPAYFIVCIQQDEETRGLWVGAAKRRGGNWAHESEARDELTCRARMLLSALIALDAARLRLACTLADERSST